jgi:hypothetical protein
LNSVDDDATVASLAGSNTLTFDWHAYNENYGGFMNFTLMYADGFCQQDATFEVLPCCPLNNIAINGNISAAIASLILKFGAANVFTTGNTLNVQNAAFTIDRDLTIDINTHFKNCKIAVSNFIDTSSPTATSIIVQNTKSFTVDATQIKACNDMWAGINCKFSSANYSNTINNINVINNSKIQDAARGVWATGGAKVTINNSVLDRNFIHLALENYYHPNTTYPVTLNGNVFECTHPLRPNLLMNDANINLSTLSTPSKTKRGIYMNKVYNATLGNPTQIAADINSTRNYIKKCLIGIETKLSGLTILILVICMICYTEYWATIWVLLMMVLHIK